MHKLPNMFLVVFGTILCVFLIIIISVVEWIVTNFAAIVAGLGGTVFLIIFLATSYSYSKDIKNIKRTFDSEKAVALITELRKKTLKFSLNILIYMIVYGILWFFAIIFIRNYFDI